MILTSKAGPKKVKEENVEGETEDETLNASQVKWDAKSGK